MRVVWLMALAAGAACTPSSGSSAPTPRAADFAALCAEPPKKEEWRRGMCDEGSARDDCGPRRFNPAAVAKRTGRTVVVTLQSQGLLDIPPERDLTCTTLMADSRDPRVTSAWEFRVGKGPPGDWRSIRTEYDSAGSIVRLIVMVGTGVGTTVVNETIGLQFRPDGTADGVRTRISLTQGAEPASMTREQPTADEIAQARTLSQWLWKRRC